MKTALPSIVLALGLFSPLALWAGPPALKIEDRHWEQLREGEVVTVSDASQGDAVYATSAVLIAAPVEAVWKVVNDKAAAPQYTKGLLRADVLSSTAKKMVVEQEMKVSPMPGTFTYIMEYHLTPYARVDFNRREGDLRSVKGYWKFDPVDGNTQTLLTYCLHLDPGFLVPQAIVQRGLKTSLPEALVAVRARVLRLAGR